MNVMPETRREKARRILDLAIATQTSPKKLRSDEVDQIIRTIPESERLEFLNNLEDRYTIIHITRPDGGL